MCSDVICYLIRSDIFEYVVFGALFIHLLFKLYQNYIEPIDDV